MVTGISRLPVPLPAWLVIHHLTDPGLRNVGLFTNTGKMLN